MSRNDNGRTPPKGPAVPSAVRCDEDTPSVPRPNVAEWLRDLDGASVPGGCDSCDAEQRVKSPAEGLAHLTVIEVRHDDWCPVLARHQRRQLTWQERAQADRHARRQAQRTAARP